MDRILVLTSEIDLFQKIQKKMEEVHEIQITTCDDNLNLMEKFMSQHTELVILDIDLLKERVVKFINILRTMKKNLQIILVLSQENMEICSEALSLGVVSYLIKPLAMENLHKIIIATLKAKNQHINKS